VATQLIDARTGYQLWSQTSEREWTQVFAMQQSIAAAIAAQLKVGRAGGQANRRAPNLEAYNLYLKDDISGTSDGADAGDRLFHEPIDNRSRRIPAQAGTAGSLSMLGTRRMAVEAPSACSRYIVP